MAKFMGVYKCEHCGNIVEVIHAGAAPLVCCGQEMAYLEENTVDAAREKHVPVIEVSGNTVKVSVGSVTHPMEEKHYIEWIELVADGIAYRQFLKPGEPPVVVFNVSAKNVTAREFCNLHGQWSAQA